MLDDVNPRVQRNRAEKNVASDPAGTPRTEDQAVFSFQSPIRNAKCGNQNQIRHFPVAELVVESEQIRSFGLPELRGSSQL